MTLFLPLQLLLESRANVSSNLVKAVGDPSSNSQYLTLSALLSGSSTTTVKEKSAAAAAAAAAAVATHSQVGH